MLDTRSSHLNTKISLSTVLDGGFGGLGSLSLTRGAHVIMDRLQGAEVVGHHHLDCQDPDRPEMVVISAGILLTLNDLREYCQCKKVDNPSDNPNNNVEDADVETGQEVESVIPLHPQNYSSIGDQIGNTPNEAPDGATGGHIEEGDNGVDNPEGCQPEGGVLDSLVEVETNEELGQFRDEGDLVE